MSNAPLASSKNGKARILLASGNPAKQATLQWLLEDLPLETVTPRELGLTSVPDEEGETHQDIARQKASAWSQAASMLVIASDGGLIIPALAPTGRAASPIDSPERPPATRTGCAACWS